MHENQIVIKDLTISYYSQGTEGIQLLYLHGWKSNKNLFQKVGNILQNKYQIIAVDLPGFGHSQIPSQPYYIEKFVEFVIDFIRALNLKDVVIVGHSMGGRIFPLLTNDSHVIGFIGTGPAGLPQRENFKMKVSRLFLRTPILKYTKVLIPEKIKDLIRSKDFRESSGFHRETIKNILKQDMTANIKEINKPTLLIWGKDDDQSPIWMAYKWHEYIQNSTLKIIENCGHFPERDFPEKTAQYIEDFIQRNLVD